MTMRRPVNQAVARFLEDKRLPEKRFAALNEIAARSSHGESPRGGAGAGRGAGIRPYWGAVAAAAVVVAIMAGMQYRALAPFSGDVHQRIADEVATNHMKLKVLEVRSGDMPEVRAFFAPLGFELVKSSLFENTPWRMIGGRFCTIQGEAAAQLRMQDEQGQVQTVYQAAYDPVSHRDLPDVMRDEEPMKLYSRGLDVQLWRERGLLFAAVSQ